MMLLGMWRPLSAVVRHHSFSITKRAAWIPRERFDLESPNFTGTSITTYSTATHRVWHHSSLNNSSRKLSWKKQSKMPPLTVLGRMSPERFNWGPSNFTHLLGVPLLVVPWKVRSLTKCMALGNPKSMQLDGTTCLQPWPDWVVFSSTGGLWALWFPAGFPYSCYFIFHHVPQWYLKYTTLPTTMSCHQFLNYCRHQCSKHDDRNEQWW